MGADRKVLTLDDGLVYELGRGRGQTHYLGSTHTFALPVVKGLKKFLIGAILSKMGK